MPLHWIGRSVFEHRVIKPRVSSRLFPGPASVYLPTPTTAVGPGDVLCPVAAILSKRATLSARFALPKRLAYRSSASTSISIITKQGETVAPADALNDWLHKHADKTQGH